MYIYSRVLIYTTLPMYLQKYVTLKFLNNPTNRTIKPTARFKQVFLLQKAFTILADLQQFYK